jgi:hypothetical protein
MGDNLLNTMPFLMRKFLEQRGLRGIHIVVTKTDEDIYNFLPWDKTLLFLKELEDSEVEEEIIKHLADYNPDASALLLVHDVIEGKIIVAMYGLPGDLPL